MTDDEAPGVADRPSSVGATPSRAPHYARSSHDLRWNFSAGVIDSAGWGLGMALISHTTILPLFVSHLTNRPEAVGAVQAVMHFGWLVPGILVAGRVERLPRVKHSVMWIAALERVMLLLLAPFCLWLGPREPGALLAAFFACWFVMNTAMGANIPGYYKLIAKTIPPGYRGRLYGIGGAAAGLLGMAAAAPAGWFLERWGFPGGYALCFLAAFVSQTVTVLPLGFMREPEQPPEAAPPRAGVLRMLALVRDDPRLFWLCAAVALFGLNGMAGAFYTLFAKHRFGLTEAAIGSMIATTMGARTAAFLLTGWIGDRWGNRAAIQLSTCAGAGAAAAAFAAPDLAWLYVALALNEVAVQGWAVCAQNYVLELCPPERSSTYTAVFGLVSGPFRVVLPLLGGLLVSAAGYGSVFGAALGGSLLALLLLLTRVPEPRAAPQLLEAEG
jgi:MFS family permease